MWSLRSGSFPFAPWFWIYPCCCTSQLLFPFLSPNNIPLLDAPQWPIQAPADGYVGCSKCLAIMSNAPIFTYKLLYMDTFSFLLDRVPTVDSRLVWYVHVYLTFKKWTSVSQSGCAILHSYQHHRRAPFPLHPQLVLLSVFLIMAIPVGMKWPHCSFKFYLPKD